MGKLVRDGIPKLAKDKKFRKCDSKEKLELLAKKLCEEALEFLISREAEELADVVEVVDELLKIYGKEKVLKIKEIKRENKGGFEECWVLED